MPAAGQITIANRTYTYSRFEMRVSLDENGKEKYSYVFELEGNNVSSLAGKAGREVSIGRAIDSRGIPYYMSQMNEFLRSFCRKFNDMQIYGKGDGTVDSEGNAVGERYTIDADGNVIPKDIDYKNGGVDTEGNQMGAFFVAIKPNGEENTFLDTKKSDGEPGQRMKYSSDAIGGNYYQLTAGNAAVNNKSQNVTAGYFASSIRTDTDESEAGIIDMMLQLESKTQIYRGAGGDQFLRYIISDITVDAQEAEILAANYGDIGSIVDTYRMSVSSVDEDEEGMDLIKFQNAYNLASKIISTMNQMYDRLITQTGV